MEYILEHAPMSNANKADPEIVEYLSKELTEKQQQQQLRKGWGVTI